MLLKVLVCGLHGGGGGVTQCLNEEWIVRPDVRKGLWKHEPIQSTHKVMTSEGKNAAQSAERSVTLSVCIWTQSGGRGVDAGV